MKNSNGIEFIPLIILVVIFMISNGCKKDNEKDDYLNPISFNTSINYGSITDLDGNIYKTLTIGTQVWMAENLKATKYNDGTNIPKVTEDSAWAKIITGAYCDYFNTEINSSIYGRLYSWYTVASSNPKNVCPTGWHIPSDAEWDTLTKYLGNDTLSVGDNIAGGKLKETGTTHWQTPNTGATNETGFTALPGGCRGHNGKFGIWGADGFWWSATEDDTTYAWYRYMEYVSKSITRGSYFKNDAFSVRCIKD